MDLLFLPRIPASANGPLGVHWAEESTFAGGVSLSSASAEFVRQG